MTVQGDYFQAMGIPLLSGRFFTAGDGPNRQLVAIVNRKLARTLLALVRIQLGSACVLAQRKCKRRG